ncbi:MAG: TerB family tellurite resistance protein [Methylibium sp.]|uniref:TerB family tellurite resistance protein n=1 Tax=Methylibium sp. TaxID=2067992 RepID=UPI0017C247D0|nr:TerB family tellurite resistance protein [Methylibium sp.]MBA2723041.1 TerB family tellurite resistance protein [Methylibium sp.]MBA3589072.1 TerB family tellurite resistance protein [Methylibium sp.]MBA3625111.1 TerB family tellurite resistance protein [Methylibium sp.]
MRTYPCNSPQAAARIVALTVLADRDIGKTELDLLDRLAVHEQLGLDRQELHAVLNDLCEDLLSSEQLQWADACPVDDRTLAGLMGDIEDPALRRRLLRLCIEIAEADEQVADGESIVLSAAVEHWGLHHEMLRSPDRDLLARTAT